MTWAVVQTESQRERSVRVLLMRLGLITYFPRIKVRGRIEPLFPSYLFVLLEKQWWSVRWTPHVIRILMNGDQPAKLSEDIVHQILKRERNGFVQLPTAARTLSKGQKVRIIRGSFEGQIGLYEGMSSRDRERVLLDLLGQAVAVELPSKDISPLNVAVERRIR